MKLGSTLFAILFIIIWNVLFLTKQHIPWYNENEYVFLVSLNLLFIIFNIAFALYRNYLSGNERLSFPDEMKVAMSAVGVYAVIVSAFTYIFYKFIDIELIPSILDNIRATMPIDQAVLLDKGISEQAYIQEQMKSANRLITPFFVSTLMLMSVMATGFFYSLLLVFLRLKFLPLLFRK